MAANRDFIKTEVMEIFKFIDGETYVHGDVIRHVYRLMQDQKRYFATRDKELLVDCKQREQAFLKFCKDNNLTN